MNSSFVLAHGADPENAFQNNVTNQLKDHMTKKVKTYLQDEIL